MDITTINRVKQAAERVLEGYGSSGAVVNSFEIATTEGLSVQYRKFGGEYKTVSGFYSPDDKTIFLNVGESATRQLYTVAHELGHYFLGHNPSEYGLYWRKSAYEGQKATNEKEADCFAANLLMPESVVRGLVKEYPFLAHPSSINLLAMRFGVSSFAMTNRLKNLRLFKAA